MLNALTAMRSDIAWVSVHTTMKILYPDPYETDETRALTSKEIMYYPSASFNRAFINDSYLNEDGNLAVPIGYNGTASQVAAMFDEAINVYANIPSFVSVNIEPSYNADTRELTVKVSGEGVEKAHEMLGDDAVVSVYLTEDDLVSRQLDGNVWDNDFEHNHVYRCAVTDVFGDAINWNGDNYENDFTVTLDSSWKPENMNIVAFVSRPLENDMTDAWVTNAEVAKVVRGETGISNAVVDGETAVEVARYALDGTQLSQPTKGVNIVKMSDGTTKKVIVK